MEKDVFLSPEVFADGPTRVLQITDIGTHQRGKRDEGRSALIPSHNLISDKMENEFKLSLRGIGISLVDLLPQVQILLLSSFIRYVFSMNPSGIVVSANRHDRNGIHEFNNTRNSNVYDRKYAN